MKSLLKRASAAIDAFHKPEGRVSIQAIPKDGMALVTLDLDGMSPSQRKEFMEAIKKQLLEAKQASGSMARLIIVACVSGNSATLASLDDAKLAELGLQRIPSQIVH